MKVKGISKLCVRSSMLGASLYVVAGSVASCSSDVPMDCTTGRGVFSVHYVYPGNVDNECGLGNGELVGAQTYQGQGSEKVGGQPLPDLSLAAAAVQPNRLGAARDAAVGAGAALEPGNTPYAYAKWDKPRPGSDNICSMAAATGKIKNEAVVGAVDDPATTDVDESTPSVAAQDLTYAWTNLRFYNTPGIQGLQFVADLAYSDGKFVNPDASVGCSTKVQAVGVFFPSAGNCMTTTRVSGVVGGTATDDLLTGSVINQAFCDDLKQSGISSDFPTVCTPATSPDFLEDSYTCDNQTPPVCTVGPKIANQGFCFLASDKMPVLK